MLKEVEPIRLTAIKGNFGSTPNLKSYPFKTPTDIGMSSSEEHEELKNNTHASLLPANPRWKRIARPDALDNDVLQEALLGLGKRDLMQVDVHPTLPSKRQLFQGVIRFLIWWRLLSSPASYNELFSVEL